MKLVLEWNDVGPNVNAGATSDFHFGMKISQGVNVQDVEDGLNK